VPAAHACDPSYSGENIRRIAIQRQPGQMVHKNPISGKNYHEKGMVEWLKVNVLKFKP
jgi:hypothetical protein